MIIGFIFSNFNYSNMLFIIILLAIVAVVEALVIIVNNSKKEKVEVKEETETETVYLYSPYLFDKRYVVYVPDPLEIPLYPNYFGPNINDDGKDHYVPRVAFDFGDYHDEIYCDASLRVNPDPEFPFIYRLTRTKVDGKWSKFSKPVLIYKTAFANPDRTPKTDMEAMENEVV